MRMRHFYFASLLAAAFLAAGAQQTSSSSTASTQPASVSVQQDVTYGTVGGQKLLLDVYQPENRGGRPRPAIVLIHGGSWSSLDKSMMKGMGNFLARSGFVAVSVDYRLLRGDENRWPAQLDDVQRAVRWLRANAATYNVDPNHIGAFGHSAGAQLAALLGMEDTRDNSDTALAKYSSRVQAVVDVSGPMDFVPGKQHGDEGMAELLGGSYEKIPDVWRDASPVYHAAKSDAPFLIVHGTQDNVVPIAQAEELYQKLQAAGVSVRLIKLDGGHTFDTPETKRQLAFESLEFFQQNLATNP
jgi:acetyl esterase/lipase